MEETKVLNLLISRREMTGDNVGKYNFVEESPEVIVQIQKDSHTHQN